MLSDKRLPYISNVQLTKVKHPERSNHWWHNPWTYEFQQIWIIKRSINCNGRELIFNRYNRLHAKHISFNRCSYFDSVSCFESQMNLIAMDGVERAKFAVTGLQFHKYICKYPIVQSIYSLFEILSKQSTYTHIQIGVWSFVMRALLLTNPYLITVRTWV